MHALRWMRSSLAPMPYTSRVLAENLVRRCEPAMLNDYLKQFIERKRELDFPWFPARVVCHDILGQTALVDLAGLRDAIAAVTSWCGQHRRATQQQTRGEPA